MKSKRTFRRETFSETTKIAFFSNIDTTDVSLCRICAGGSPMFAPEKIAEIFLIGTREIYRRVESGKVHFVETDNLRILVCLKSLTQNSLKESQ
jgi:hypothetical protein